MSELQQIQQTLKTHGNALAGRYHVRRFGVFGSVVHGDQTATSDIDVLVEFSRPIGLFQFIELEEELKALLNKDVDLVTPNALHPLIKTDVLRETVYV
ncbi:nucleotidyltransferase family protein [Candidatus Gottesmanbacteria bacterium]|nr:nucleotidyltransferase family protein [Candidatus Gottesmanbacteria bacterium]